MSKYSTYYGQKQWVAFMKESNKREEKRQLLANYAHESWSGWMKYLFSKSLKNDEGQVLIPKELVERWERQISTPYGDLTRAEQKSDLQEADKIINIILEKK